MNNDEILDLAIIGGGITGVTAAYLFSDTNLKVSLFDRSEVGKGETSHTSAMLTHEFDTPLSTLVETVGLEKSKQIWIDGKRGLDFIVNFIQKENIKCDLKICPSYLYPNDNEGLEFIKKEYELIKEIGFDVEIVDNFHPEFNLDSSNKIALKLPNQAKFSPTPYIKKLKETSLQNGIEIYENTNIEDIEKVDDLFVLKSKDKIYKAKKIFVATHFPYTASALYCSNFKPYNTYCIYAEIPKGMFEYAVYWDTKHPYHYWRIDKNNDEKDGLLIGGCDHHTGKIESEFDPKESLKNYVESVLKVKNINIIDFWSGQVIDSLDLIPVIGEYEKDHFIASGFRGNGLTFGTFSAISIFEKLTKNIELPDIYSPNRKFPLGKFLKTGMEEGVSFTKDLIKGAFNKKDDEESGEVVREGAKLVGIYKDKKGNVSKINPYCTHMKCLLRWNKSVKSWDCPCHGSRFDKEGKVITGPAKKDLERYA